MKKIAFISLIGLSFQAFGQSVQYATLWTTNNNATVLLTVSTNALVQLLNSTGATTQGHGAFGVVGFSGNNSIWSGLTNISLSTIPGGTAIAFFQITTPASASTVISNYVPADAIVIPASATGNVQIILESSPDLVNWTAASPGTYGAAAGTNRFFRVRAQAN